MYNVTWCRAFGGMKTIERMELKRYLQEYKSDRNTLQHTLGYVPREFKLDRIGICQSFHTQLEDSNGRTYQGHNIF